MNEFMNGRNKANRYDVQLTTMFNSDTRADAV